ncbi:MAG TPA: hypothetical protein VHC63_00865 [Acidimicrobiales bacterium]|nr:hypothetical protein [Acidimicrobiales bacterium]
MADTPDPTPAAQAEFEAMLRRYFAKLGRRYAPFLIGLALLLIVVILVPTTEPVNSQLGTGDNTALGTGNRRSSSGDSTGTGDVTGDTTPAASGDTSGGDSGTVTGPAADFIGSSGSTSGVARSGVTCGEGVRQFTWSSHAPLCEAAFSGNNGGATGQGVTASTVTLTFRIPSSTQDQAIGAAAGAANVNYNAMVADMQTYIGFFNKQFELYGRKVVLKAYKGQGDYISEDQGQNLAGAQADAVTAHDMGAFGDVTFSLGASQPYEQDLADEHVMSFSALGQPQSWFEQYAPYEWSVQGPSGSTGVLEAAAFVCRRMANMPAIFSGDAVSQKTKRVFGIVFPEIPTYAALAKQYQDLLKSQCGVTVAQTSGYTVNVAQFPTQAGTIGAQMRSSGVTTILCACDPIFPIFLTRSAQGQGYHPEWVAVLAGDPSGRLYQQTEWAHALGGGAQSPDPKTTEAYKVFKLANPGGEPAEGSSNGGPPYFYVPYYTLLHVFEGLQAAGPNLTAANFQQGMFSLPPSGVDPIGGQWEFGNKVYDPVTSFSIAYWDPNGTSAFDGKAGRYLNCNGGQIYNVNHLDELGGPNEQLHCFGH